MTRHPVTRLFAFVLALLLAWGGLASAQAAAVSAGPGGPAAGLGMPWQPAWQTAAGEPVPSHSATHAAALAPLELPDDVPLPLDEPSVVVADPSADLTAVLPAPTGLRHTLVAATVPRPAEGLARRPPFLDSPQRPPSA